MRTAWTGSPGLSVPASFSLGKVQKLRCENTRWKHQSWIKECSEVEQKGDQWRIHPMKKKQWKTISMEWYQAEEKGRLFRTQRLTWGCTAGCNGKSSWYLSMWCRCIDNDDSFADSLLIIVTNQSVCLWPDRTNIQIWAIWLIGSNCYGQGESCILMAKAPIMLGKKYYYMTRNKERW